ncbi:hypothetical protein N8368_03940 [Bacteroidia bacterium]|nr:hypothetical protein [Bacteroidia bacterium]
MNRSIKTTLKIALAILAFTFTTNVLAQVSISCRAREYCNWNSDDEKFEDCSGREESSLFVLNENRTLFTHTTETMSSTYYIQDVEHDKENDLYLYKVISDVGNKYLYVFDIKNDEIRALPLNGDLKLVRFYIKATF